MLNLNPDGELTCQSSAKGTAWISFDSKEAGPNVPFWDK